MRRQIAPVVHVRRVLASSGAWDADCTIALDWFDGPATGLCRDAKAEP